MTFDATETTHVTLIATSQYQPQTQDPLGLTYAQWQANPRQADPVATQFDTNKTINQMQGGVAVDQALNADTSLRVTAYGGQRQVRQYLALSGVGATSSGGVVDLDRNYEGVGVRVIWRGSLMDRPLTLNVGADVDRLHELRQGFVNNNGSLGALRRDEDDTVTSGDVYAEARWDLVPALSLTLGVRSSQVKYDSVDHYIVGPNPDDSGKRHYYNTSPIVGVVWHAAENLNLYASYGQGFETPTFAEMAYRPTGPGLNLALDPATSTAYEIGMKWFPTTSQRLNLAAFTATTDQEIVVDSATGGRTTYRNASQTKRRGFEAAWDADLGQGLSRNVNRTYLLADFAEPFATGIPPVVTPGSRCLACLRNSYLACLNGHPADTRASAWPARCSMSAGSMPMKRTRPSHPHTRSATCASASRSRRANCSFPNTSASTTSPMSITSARSSSAIPTGGITNRRRGATGTRE